MISRPYFDLSYFLLKETVQKNPKNKKILQSILDELSFRKNNPQNIDLSNLCKNYIKNNTNAKKAFKQKLFNLGDYKYKKRKPRDEQDSYTMKILDFKNEGYDDEINFFAKKIIERFKRINTYKFTFLRVPSSDAENTFTSCNRLIQKIISLSSKSHIDGGSFLIRHKTINKQQDQDKEVRHDKERHLNSINIDESKIIYIKENVF